MQSVLETGSGRRVTFLVETFPAELTDERLVPGVDPHVRVERGASVERLPTLVTFMRLFLNRKQEGKLKSNVEFENGRN